MSQNHTDLLTVIQLAASKFPAGEVMFTSGEKSGRIFIQEGRVRWAFAKGQIRSFQNILHEEKKLDKKSIVSAVKSSRENGSLDLDDVLVRLGLDKELERTEVILEHTPRLKKSFRILPDRSFLTSKSTSTNYSLAFLALW